MSRKTIKVSDGVRAILDDVLRRMGQDAITPEEAENLYGGHYMTTVNQLDDIELMQVALLEAYAIMGSNAKKSRKQRRARTR